MKHGTYWIIQPEQEMSHVHTDYGTKTPKDSNVEPLNTIEAPDEFSKTKERFESVRYFERKS